MYIATALFGGEADLFYKQHGDGGGAAQQSGTKPDHDEEEDEGGESSKSSSFDWSSDTDKTGYQPEDCL